MDNWPPPSAADAQPAPGPLSGGASERPGRFAKVLIVGWVVGGLVALALIGVTASRGNDTAATLLASTTTSPSDEPLGSTNPSTTIEPTDTTSAPSPPTATTEPQVRSAPPVPPPTSARPDDDPDATEPSTRAPTTTIVVTLPPTTPPAEVPPPMIEIEIRFDADGDDEQNSNDEWVRFTNVGDQAVDMTGWIARDDGLVHAHVFSELVVQPDAAVTLFSGCGLPTDTERFFCASEVWNNDGDVVSLFDADGELVAQRRG